MVKSYTKTAEFMLAILMMFALIGGFAANAFAAEANTNFNVNVKEGLSVSITTPAEWASGNIDTFLRNKVNISVSTNNAAGFTASMTTQTANTSLVNTTKNTETLPTLGSSSTRSSFPANYWGYSLDDTDAGSSSSTYNALVGVNSTPITLLTSATAGSGSKDFYFGAKANVTKAGGTYTGTVVINVVTGVIDNNTNPVTPVNPAHPNSTPNTATHNAAPTGGSSSGVTVYTYSGTSGSGSSATNTTTTEVSDGNNVDLYNGYTPPQGVNESFNTVANIADGSGAATGLATTASVAAASGLLLLIVAKRREDDEEEEEAQS